MLAFSIDYYGIFFGATQSVELFCTYDTLVLWMAGIEAVDAWDEYKREKNRNKSNHGSGVKKNGKNKKETRV